MAGTSLYLKKPGREDLGWLMRCACCRELGAPAASIDKERALFLGQDLMALFCSSERCEGTVRLRLREMFGELDQEKAGVLAAPCANCNARGGAVSLRYAGETLVWICVGCIDFARKGIGKTWPDALPYVNDQGHEIERPTFDRPALVDDALGDIIGVPSCADVDLKEARRRALKSRSLTRQRRWTRGVVWLPDGDERPNRRRFFKQVQAPFRPFALLLWSFPGRALVTDFRINRERQLLTDTGIPGEVFAPGVSIEVFRALVSAPGSAEGGLPTIAEEDWDRLRLAGGRHMWLEFPTMTTGDLLEVEIEGPYERACIMGKVLTLETAPPAPAAERGEA